MRVSKTVLITGAGGFIGANLAKTAVSRFKSIHVFVKPTTNLWRIKDILKHMHVHNVDLLKAPSVKRVLQKIKPDVIFHLAAHGGYPNQNVFLNVVNNTINTTVNLLEAVRKLEFKSFVHTGSSSEYGFKDHPMKETDFLDPTFLYAAAKGSSTLICKSFARTYKKPVVTLRLFSVYGPLEEPTRLIPTVITNTLRRRPISMTSGKEVRDFIHVDDVIDAYYKVASCENVSGEIFNIGTGKETSIKQVLDMVFKLARKSVTVNSNLYKPRIWDTNHWVADISKAKEKLGWKPNYTLEKGLKKTIDWFQANLNLY